MQCNPAATELTIRSSAWWRPVCAVLVAGALAWPPMGSSAKAATPGDSVTATQPARADMSSQSRRKRGPTRLIVHPNFSYPGPNAVRQCEAHYEQEYRQSGTVIVPRMNCWWQRG